MQNILTDNDSREESQIETLERLRNQYFDEYIKDIQIFKINLKQRTTSYINTVKNIDDDLDKLRKREEPKKKLLQNISKKLWR